MVQSNLWPASHIENSFWLANLGYTYHKRFVCISVSDPDPQLLSTRRLVFLDGTRAFAIRRIASLNTMEPLNVAIIGGKQCHIIRPSLELVDAA